MSIYIRPEAGVPMPDRAKSEGFVPLLQAAAETAKMLAEVGLDFVPEDKDLLAASELMRAYAGAVDTKGSMNTSTKVTRQTPASLILTRDLLDKYGHRVIEEADEIRHMVLNRLVQETDHPDPRVRIRAMELLGKVGEVGLFTERREVTVTHQTSTDVKERLRARLSKLIPRPEEVPDAEIVEEAPSAVEIVEEAPSAVEIVEEVPPAVGIDDDYEIFELDFEPREANGSLFDD